MLITVNVGCFFGIAALEFLGLPVLTKVLESRGHFNQVLFEGNTMSLSELQFFADLAVFRPRGPIRPPIARSSSSTARPSRSALSSVKACRQGPRH